MKKNKNRLTTFVVLFSSATAIIHIANKIIAASASLKEMLDSNRRNYYKWRLEKFFIQKKGSGSPVLLIHDMLPGACGYEWNRIEEELAMEHTVYTIDLLGCGRSEKPGVTYTNFVYVQVICDFIRNVIGEKTDVITSGFSGSFAVMACRNEKSFQQTDSCESACPRQPDTNAVQKRPSAEIFPGNPCIWNSCLSHYCFQSKYFGLFY